MARNIIFESLTTDIIKSESILQGYLSINDNKNINNDLVNAIINNDNINIYVVYDDNSKDELLLTNKEVDTESALKSFNYEFDGGYIRTDNITNVAFSILSDESPIKFVFYTEEDTPVMLKSGSLRSSNDSNDISKIKLSNATYNIKDAIARSDILTKQDTLVSGTNIKTINNTSLLGSGNIAVQPTLVSGTNIKKINNNSLLGSGNISVQPTLVSGTNIKTINNNSLLGNGNITINDATIINYNTDTYEVVENKLSDLGKLIIVHDNSSTSYVISTGMRSSDDAYVIYTLAYDHTSGVSINTRPCFCEYYITPNDVWERYIKSNFSPINSPNFTGIPKAPTAAIGTNTTQIATTAFVQNALGDLSDATIFKGTIGSATQGSGTRSDIPTTGVNVGDIWLIVDEARTLSAAYSATGQAVLLDVGDTILAVSDDPLWATSPAKDDIGVTSVNAGVGLTTGADGTTGGAITTSGTLSETYTTITLPAFSTAGLKRVNLSGITSSSHPILDIVIPNNTSSSSIKAMMDAWAHIYNAETGAGVITFYSDAATTTQLTIAVKGY